MCLLLGACASDKYKDADREQKEVYQGPDHRWSPDLDKTDLNGEILRAVGLP
jgi:hypothetical protein